MRILKTEGEITPEAYSKDVGILSQDVDDFLSAEDPGSGVHRKMRI